MINTNYNRSMYSMTQGVILLLCLIAMSCKKTEFDPVEKQHKREGLYFYMKTEDQEIYYKDSIDNYKIFPNGGVVYGSDPIYMKGPTTALIKNYQRIEGIDLQFVQPCSAADYFTSDFYYSIQVGKCPYSNSVKGLEGVSIYWNDKEDIQWSSNDVNSYNRNNEDFFITKIENTEAVDIIIISGKYTATLVSCIGTKKVEGDFRLKIDFQNN